MRGLIITGGTLDIEFAKEYIKCEEFDKVLVADYGLFYAKQLNLVPDYILGDFDSCDKAIMQGFKDADTTIFPCEKDDTDTGLAMKKACEIGMDEVVLLGATGTRLDHVLGNLGQLNYAKEHGVKARIVDAKNHIYLADRHTVVNKDQCFGTYISLIPLNICHGVSLKGFKYPLQEDTLVFQETWGISNELIDQVGEITFQDGTLLVIESRD